MKLYEVKNFINFKSETMLVQLASLDTYGLWRIKYILLICPSIKLCRVEVSHNTIHTVSFRFEAHKKARINFTHQIKRKC